MKKRVSPRYQRYQHVKRKQTNDMLFVGVVILAGLFSWFHL